MKNKLCVSVFVSGERYAHYIPFFLFFMQKSYPEYFTLISYKDSLPLQVIHNIDLLDKRFFKVNENVFKDFPNDANTTKTARWVMVPEEYQNFECIFITDIDIFTIREEPTLFTRHLEEMQKNNLPYSTALDTPKRGKRMGGLFFFSRKEYLNIALPTMNKYRELIFKEGGVSYFRNEFSNRVDNQFALYTIVAESGLDIPHDYSMKYHGLHLGHSRCEGRWEVLLRGNRPVAEGDHKEYYEKYLPLSKDPIFRKIFDNAIPVIQREITIIDDAYNRVMKEENEKCKQA